MTTCTLVSASSRTANWRKTPPPPMTTLSKDLDPVMPSCRAANCVQVGGLHIQIVRRDRSGAVRQINIHMMENRDVVVLAETDGCALYCPATRKKALPVGPMGTVALELAVGAPTLVQPPVARFVLVCTVKGPRPPVHCNARFVPWRFA